ncbi:methyltransferase domain-containing protein [Nonomuraea sp. NPDC049714]|uniref:methyltransferase domain-containing protein n=1 Tax=Nonomuraea sp. NPDC049714 TaxID=3364357 RepID=UPI0037968FAB
MTDDVNPLGRFALAGTAQSRVEEWAAGAQALALLTLVHEQGWTAFLAEPRDLGQLATFSHLPIDTIANIVAVLEAHGFAERRDGQVRLSPAYAALSADDAMVDLGNLLDRAELMTRLVREAAQGTGDLSLGGDDALVIAKAAGGRTTPVTQAVYGRLLETLPEFAEAIRDGRLLDVGCGVAGFGLTAITMFPNMRSVGIELVPTVAAEAESRAKTLGVADRVDVRCLDAQDFDERDAFDACFWAQPFFPEHSRAGTLRMIRRALKPGALLVMQEMEREPQDEAQRLAFVLRRLVYEGLGVPFAQSAERLIVEGEAAGLAQPRMVATDFGRIVLMRRPEEG